MGTLTLAHAGPAADADVAYFDALYSVSDDPW